MRTRKKKHLAQKRCFNIYLGTFNLDVMVAVNMNQDEIAKAVQKNWQLDQKQFAAFRESELRHWGKDNSPGQMMKLELGAGYIVALNTGKHSPYQVIGFLVHELVHVVQYLLRDRRIPLTLETEEVHAYLTQYLVRVALNEMHDL